MDIVLNIESKNAREMALFYANLFKLQVVKVPGMPYDVYQCSDIYCGFNFLQTTGKYTTGISFSVKVENLIGCRERALRAKLDIVEDNNSMIQIKDPQNNTIGILPI